MFSFKIKYYLFHNFLFVLKCLLNNQENENVIKHFINEFQNVFKLANKSIEVEHFVSKMISQHRRDAQSILDWSILRSYR